MKRALLIVVLLVGCGGSDSPSDPLANTAWIAPIQGFTCEFGFQFGATKDYTFLVACVLNNQSQAVYVENGEYFTVGNQITMTAHEASCPRELVQVVLTANYTVSATTFTLSDNTGATVFDRFYPTTPSAGTITVGCFDDQLYFTPYPLGPI